MILHPQIRKIIKELMSKKCKECIFNQIKEAKDAEFKEIKFKENKLVN